MDPVAHYVRHGVGAGCSPNPLFSPRHYLAQDPTAERSTLGPFVHFLRRGAAKGHSPHPVFDVEHYLTQVPDALSHRGGALGHYLAVGWQNGVKVNTWFNTREYRERHPEAGVTEPAIVHLARHATAQLAAVPDHRGFPRLYGGFDHARAERFVAEMAEAVRSIERPLVTVVMPVRDRADTIGAAIRSVLEQSYRDLELLVVDDGSVDRTVEVVRSFDDPRLRLIQQPPVGVCRARNRAIAQAGGRYLAYLDSDNVWEPGFLATMVAFLCTTEHDVAYSALEIERGRKRLYRGAPLDRAALLEANYIDCSTLVHERALIDRVGGWDESLRRANDWDFVIRLTEVGDVGYAPFIGVRYDHDRERGDRITVREPFGYKFKVYAKHHFDWPAIARRPVVAGRTSIIVPVAAADDDLDAGLEALCATTGGTDVEVLVVDNSPSEEEAYRAFCAVDACAQARLVRPTWMELYAPLTLAYGLAESSGDVVVVVDPALVAQPGWLEPLVAPIRSGEAVMTQGPVLEWNGVVASAGYLVDPGGSPAPALEGFPEHGPEVAVPADRQGLSRMLLAIDRSALLAVEGFDPLYRSVLADVDLTLRLRAVTQRPARFVPSPGGALRPVVEETDPTIVEQDQRVFMERWGGELLPDVDETFTRLGLQVRHHRPSGFRGAGVDAHVPVVEHAADRVRPLRWAIKIAASTVGVRNRWGDWHFALALRDELVRLGHDVVVDLMDGWYRPTAHLEDVVLVLRGKGRYRINPDQLNLVWLISHPDLPGDDELVRYDHRFVASGTFARKLQQRLGVPTDPLLQCTDARRFVPGPVDPDGEEVLFVGNTRGGSRPIVDDALAAGLPLGVYGAHWKGRIPRAVWHDRHVPNAQLPALYRSAGVVLNDHWEDMRREGFLSNRLFDLAACGANIVSDPIEGLEEVFGGLVRTYRRPEELADVVQEALTQREDERERRLTLSERIRAEHSFAVRARELDRVARELLRARSDGVRPLAAG